MFIFANVLLLALFAAAVWDAVAALRAAGPGAGRMRRALGRLWSDEHLLFGSWCADARLKAGTALFAAGLASYEISVAFCNSTVRLLWAWPQGILGPALDWFAFLCFGAKILFGTKYSWRSLGLGGALYFIARWVHFNSHNIWWIGIVVAVLAAKDVRLDKPLKAYLIGGAAAMAAVAALYFGGVLTDDLLSTFANERGTGNLRGTYGYGHPNTFGGLFLGLVLAYAMLRARKVRWGDCALVFAAGVFLLAGPKSRSAGLAALALAAGLAVCRLRAGKRVPRALPVLAGLATPAVAALSFWLPSMMYYIGPHWSDFGPAWLARLDTLLNGRLASANIAFNYLTLAVAGQILPDWPPIDNSFVSSLYQFGPVAAALLVALYTAALYGHARQGHGVETVCLLAMLAYAYMEVQSFHLTTNPTALLLAGAVFALPLARWPSAAGPSRPIPPTNKEVRHDPF